jgi:hypothetical protein
VSSALASALTSSNRSLRSTERTLTQDDTVLSQRGRMAAFKLVSADGSVRTEIYPGSRLKGGFTVLELPTREDAVEWARKLAVACRCLQELREFMYDPES